MSRQAPTPRVQIGGERFVLYDDCGRELCRSRDVQELRWVLRASGVGRYWAMAFASDGKYDYIVARYRLWVQAPPPQGSRATTGRPSHRTQAPRPGRITPYGAAGQPGSTAPHGAGAQSGRITGKLINHIGQ